MQSENSVVAEGRIQKLVMVALFAGAVIGVGTWYPVFAQGYDVQNSAKLACNDAIKQFRFHIEGQETAYKEPFLRRCTQAGVRLGDKQYKFSVTHDKQTGHYVCKVHIHYPTKYEWAFIGDIFAIEPIIGKKVIDLDHLVRDSY